MAEEATESLRTTAIQLANIRTVVEEAGLVMYLNKVTAQIDPEATREAEATREEVEGMTGDAEEEAEGMTEEDVEVEATSKVDLKYRESLQVHR
jgi:hypothetical protein